MCCSLLWNSFRFSIAPALRKNSHRVNAAGLKFNFVTWKALLWIIGDVFIHELFDLREGVCLWFCRVFCLFSPFRVCFSQRNLFANIFLFVTGGPRRRVPRLLCRNQCEFFAFRLKSLFVRALFDLLLSSIFKRLTRGFKINDGTQYGNSISPERNEQSTQINLFVLV